MEHGWDFDKIEKQGLLIFVSPSLLDTQTDKLLYQIVNAVNKAKAKRVVIDAISTMESANLNQNKVREFLLQLYSFFKMKGITCVITYLSTSIFDAKGDQVFGGGEATELRLSSVVDGAILLRYAEQKGSVKRFFNVLKMRGSKHDKTIRTFEITKKGVKIGGFKNKAK